MLIPGGIGHFEDILNFRREDTETKKGARILGYLRIPLTAFIAKSDLIYSPKPTDPSPLRVNSSKPYVSMFKKYLTPLDMSRCQGA